VLNLPFRTDRRDAMTLSAAISDIKLEFVDGVTGESIKQSAYPPPDENLKLLPGIRGSWRTHMNALQRLVDTHLRVLYLVPGLIRLRVVEQNLTTAFILEDDVDWDIRVRQNLQRFALASRVLSSNQDLLTTSPNLISHVEHRANTETKETAFQIIDTKNLPKTLPSLPLSSIYKKSTVKQPHSNDQSSPYGDPSQWDILWIGHCGAGFPRNPQAHDTSVTPSNLILTHSNDATVPVGKFIKAHPFQGGPDPLATAFPPHTRIYHRSTGGELCTVGYAISQRGARRLLHQFGIKGWSNIFDAEMGRWCAGEDPEMGRNFPKPVPGAKKKERVCITSHPPIFAHHHPMEGESDIGGLGGGYARKYETKYLRYSVRMNLEGLVEGKGERELVDQWPDDGE
jgi:GR25 family glycosyltransferase involved in LPS biosynthesis